MYKPIHCKYVLYNMLVFNFYVIWVSVNKYYFQSRIRIYDSLDILNIH